jgi:hypothetical protein
MVVEAMARLVAHFAAADSPRARVAPYLVLVK